MDLKIKVIYLPISPSAVFINNRVTLTECSVITVVRLAACNLSRE